LTSLKNQIKTTTNSFCAELIYLATEPACWLGETAKSSQLFSPDFFHKNQPGVG